MYTINGHKATSVHIGVTKISYNTGMLMCNVSKVLQNTCYDSSFRSMKRARDVREQLVGLMQRVEMELVSGITETVNIRKVR